MPVKEEEMDWDEEYDEELEWDLEEERKERHRRKGTSKAFIAASIVIVFLIITTATFAGIAYYLYQNEGGDVEEKIEREGSNFILPEKDRNITNVEIGNDSISYRYNKIPDKVDLRKGDIISGTTGFGYLREVTDVVIDDKSVFIRTVNASLTDVVDVVNISMNQTLNMGNELTRSTRRFDLSTTLYKGGGTTVDFIGEATISDPRMVFELDYDIINGLKWLNFYVEQTYTCFLGIEATHSTTIEKNRTLATYNLAPITVMVGPVPVVLTPELEFSVGAELTIEAGITTYLDMSMTLTAGIYYSNNRWAPYTNLDHEFDYSPPSLDMSVSAKAYAVLPKFSLMIYGVVGPYLEFQPFLQFDGSLNSNPMWTLYAGIEIFGGVHVEIDYWIDTYLVADVKMKVYDKRWIVAQAPIRTPPLDPILSIDPNSDTGNYQVTWNPVPDVEYYTLEEDDDPGFNYPSTIYSGTENIVGITGKTDGTYYYRVRATNDIGNSDWSGILSIVVEIPYAPDIPSITLTPTSSTGEYEVRWSSISDAILYTLEEDEQIGFSSPDLVYSGQDTSILITAKEDGSYHYRVKATNNFMDGGWSDIKSISVELPKPPVTPSGLSAPSSSNTGDYQITWDHVLDADYYELEEDDNEQFSSPMVIFNGLDDSKDINDKSDGVYYYRIRSFNQNGNSEWSPPVSIIVLISTVPMAPIISVPSSSSSGQYTISWTEVSDIESYTLEEAIEPTFNAPYMLYTGDDTSKNIIDRNDGTYYYRVKATNDVGDSPWSDIESIDVLIDDTPEFIEDTISGVTFNFAKVKSGSFIMGEDDEENLEKPAHKVYINYTFQIGIYEVTQEQWEALMPSNPSSFSGDSNPVEDVTWDDCQDFIDALNSRDSDHTYRLPSEAEWEYCCRAGTNTSFSFGDDHGDFKDYGWGFLNSDDKPHPVGRKTANDWGLYDMHGNIWEWCQDSYHDSYNGAPNDGSAWESSSPIYRMLRGGGYQTSSDSCRSGYRINYFQGFTFEWFGLRLVRTEN